MVETKGNLPLKLVCRCGQKFTTNVYPSDGLCPVCIRARQKSLTRLHSMVFRKGGK